MNTGPTDVPATDDTSDGRALDSAPPPSRRARALVLLAVFLLSLFGYGACRLYISDEMYGGDVVSFTHARPTSYRLGPAEVTNLRGFYATLHKGKSSSAATDPISFAYSQLSPEGKDALEKLLSNSEDPRLREVFFLEMNRSLLDREVDWPSGLADRVGDCAGQSPVNRIQERNYRVLHRILPELIKPAAGGAPTGFWADLTRRVKGAFTITRPDRYTPVTNLYSRAVLDFLRSNPGGVLVGIGLAALVYATTVTVVFCLCCKLIGSLPWAVMAALLFLAASSTLMSVQMLYSLPYLFVTLAMSAAFVAYLQYRDTGRLQWLGVFVVFAVLAPWCREYAAATAFIVTGCEILRFRRHRRRSLVIILVCLPLMAHAVYPSFLPWLVGWNDGHVYGMFDMQQFKHQHSSDFIFWHLFGFVFVQLPPVLWLVVGVAIVCWLLGKHREPVDRNARSAAMVLLKRFGAVVVVFVLGAFVYSFYVANAAMEHFMYLKYGLALAGPACLLALVSLRFNAIGPLYLAALLVPLLRVQVAEIHQAFLAVPLAIIVTLWIRDLANRLRAGRRTERKRNWALIGFWVLVGIGVFDQFLNIPAACHVQRQLVRTNLKMARWMKDNIPRHSIVVANFYNIADVYFYTDYHFAPYETVENCPLGPRRVVHKEEVFRKLCAANFGVRRIYLIEAEHKYFSWQEKYHSHKYVRNPPGRLEKRLAWPGRETFVYADPLKRLTPRFWVSFPGYMDWGTDFWYDHHKGMFRRTVHSDYSLYELSSLRPTTAASRPEQ